MKGKYRKHVLRNIQFAMLWIFQFDHRVYKTIHDVYMEISPLRKNFNISKERYERLLWESIEEVFGNGKNEKNNEKSQEIVN